MDFSSFREMLNPSDLVRGLEIQDTQTDSWTNDINNGNLPRHRHPFHAFTRDDAPVQHRCRPTYRARGVRVDVEYHPSEASVSLDDVS